MDSHNHRPLPLSSHSLHPNRLRHLRLPVPPCLSSTKSLPPSPPEVFKGVYQNGAKFVAPGAIMSATAFAYLAYAASPSQRRLYGAAAALILSTQAWTAGVMLPGIPQDYGDIRKCGRAAESGRDWGDGQVDAGLGLAKLGTGGAECVEWGCCVVWMGGRCLNLLRHGK